MRNTKEKEKKDFSLNIFEEKRKAWNYLGYWTKMSTRIPQGEYG